MEKKNKLWFSGEDAQLAARFTKCLTKALYNRRASYLRAKAEQAASEISIEECSEEVDKMYIPRTRPVEEIVESKLMWESIRKYLHKLTPKECEVMISLYPMAQKPNPASAPCRLYRFSGNGCWPCRRNRKKTASCAVGATTKNTQTTSA